MGRKGVLVRAAAAARPAITVSVFPGYRREMTVVKKTAVAPAVALTAGAKRNIIRGKVVVCAVVAEEEHDKYKKVWVAKDDPAYQKNKSNRATLRKLWKKRLANVGTLASGFVMATLDARGG